ncbi:hypothetical protein EMIHUDRAFT_230480 [Emiliania huxleyi CCMP1516]|uniref:Carboxylesterase type B domain-containing protein n=2 Tax=Emiliania huxleyi TaxID=2903 RepID=A0A0D3KAB3_EMIH1|nr:hypothetical protein EMIHUDRAFT_230480 [Emiliania huxleyi CCMP1516]EOD32698.1 hypothetical protein EMIHUDRAFT_230480 [Emiliania huxleyi CCMP1516]|eukprot:XP_005785127.1 hypothetical protein EMIHUDRAFT_230480 [Emiliania huxleyi CCMP1516]
MYLPERSVAVESVAVGAAIKAYVTGGVAVGRVQAGSVAAFRGIPYGNAERFLPPTPAASWVGELDASADGPACPGKSPPYDRHMSEQCLSLNVFTPVAALGNASAQLAVLVYLYGGSLNTGSVASYGPIENLVSGSEGRAMLVVMNYRLGALGFAALKELSDADPRGTSGNLGLLDQQLAMRWVAANAAAFGGDPRKATLLGQSSGGTSIFAHLAAPASRGLFHAAISISASPNLTISYEEKLRQDEEHWFKHTPCAREARGAATLACLRAASVESLQAALEPRYDYFDFNHSFAASAAKAGYDVPVLLQNLEGELNWQPDPTLESIRTRAEAAARIEGMLAAGLGAEAARRLYAMYAGVGGDNDTLAAAPAYALNADTGCTCGQLALALAASEARRSEGTAPVYISLVRARPYHPFGPLSESCTRPAIYAFHLWDFFAAVSVGAPTAAERANWYDARFDEAWVEGSKCGPYRPAPTDVKLGRALLEQWLSFAEHAGFPDGVGWRAVDDALGWPRHYTHGVIDDAGLTSSVVDLKSDACTAWREAGYDSLQLMRKYRLSNESKAEIILCSCQPDASLPRFGYVRDERVLSHLPRTRMCEDRLWVDLLPVSMQATLPPQQSDAFLARLRRQGLA